MNSLPFSAVRVALRGGGDLGSGVAYRLVQSGFPLLITELPAPLLVRRAVSFGSAVIENEICIEGLCARCVESLEAAYETQAAGLIPVMVDPAGDSLAAYAPAVLIDARMNKRPPEGWPGQPLLRIGLGPGFAAGENCDAVIETNRGHFLGRVIWQGAPEADTGVPGEMKGQTTGRVLRAPNAGSVRALQPIGTRIRPGDPLIMVGGTLIRAGIEGVLRGVVHDGIEVEAGEKIGDLDPRAQPEYCFAISEKSLAVGGGVLEAILHSKAIRALLAGAGSRP